MKSYRDAIAGNDVERDNAPSPSKIQVRISRMGLHVGFIAAFSLLAGSLRGMSLLQALGSLLIGILLVQWRLCRRSLESVHVRRQPCPDMLAGQTAKIGFYLDSASRFLPAWLIQIEDWICMPDQRSRFVAASAVGVVSPGAHAETHYQCTIHRRGCYPIDHTLISSGFPLGLLYAKQTLYHNQTAILVVYPRLLTLQPNWQNTLQTLASGKNPSIFCFDTGEGDFYGLREWQSGDSRRWIHWRTTARIGEPAVRQFEQHQRIELCIIVDVFRTTEDSYDRVAERAIQLAATLVLHIARQPTNRVVLIVAGRHVQHVASLPHRDFQQDVMRLLAQARPVESPDLDQAGRLCDQATHGDLPVMVISPVAADLSRLAKSKMGETSGDPGPSVVNWIDVQSPEAEQLVNWEPDDAPS